MAAKKTTPTPVKPTDFIAAIEHDVRRKDAKKIVSLMKSITGSPPKMWGPSIVGFGRYEYKTGAGKDAEFMIVGFSPRKANQVIYLMPGYEDLTEPLSRLGKHKIGKSCLYINKLDDVDLDVLTEIITTSFDTMKSTYTTHVE